MDKIQWDKLALVGKTTTFYGCNWVEQQWEFDAPSVLYNPVYRYAIGGGGEVERMVEDFCFDVEQQGAIRPKLSKFENKEFAWRGWRMRDMKRRKQAYHTRVVVRWFIGDRDRLEFEIVDSTTQHGPF